MKCPIVEGLLEEHYSVLKFRCSRYNFW